MQEVIRAGFRPVCMEDFTQMILYSLRRLGRDGVAALGEVGEGLENRIIRAAGRARTIEELIQSIKTKRYTRTRLHRILLYALLGIDKALLGALRSRTHLRMRVSWALHRQKGSLGQNRKKENLDLVSKAADYKPGNEILRKLFSIDVLGSDLYASVQPAPAFRAWGQDYTMPIHKALGCRKRISCAVKRRSWRHFFAQYSRPRKTKLCG